MGEAERSGPPHLRLPLQFELGRHRSLAEQPAHWIAATVPGAVQIDWARANGLPDFTIGDNVKAWADLDEFHWTYRASLAGVPACGADERWFLVLEGVDYACEVRIGSAVLAASEGMQTPVVCDVTTRLNPAAVLEVVILPAPKSRAEPKDRVQANRSCKPAVGYGWDFHPRLIPLGLWCPAYLEKRPLVHFAVRPFIDCTFSEDLNAAKGTLAVQLASPASAGTHVHWTLSTEGGEVVLDRQFSIVGGQSAASVPFEVTNPVLWWPHDQGRPTLYRSVAQLVGADGRILDRAEWRHGFRRVRLVMAPGQWKEPSAFPKSRSRPPMTLEVNGRSLFAKGTNWVCPDIFPGTLTSERYRQHLELVRGANLSLLRMWGGATAPHDAFYAHCDELGIMVWQEFPLACNAYPDDAAYLAVLDRESRSLIERLRGHASLVLWCGGNELFNAWSGMTDQSLALRLLNRNCYDLDPARPFLATSPVDGVGHGHYVFRDPLSGREAWEFFQDATCTAYTEFGCPATPSADTLRRILSGPEVWPPLAGTTWETHHAFGAWLPSSHLYLEEIEAYFGSAASLEELVERAQWLQAAGYQGLYEEARRQKPVASMALNWCLNEPWPCAANNSLVAWPCEPKPALRAVADACRPVLASARLRKFSWAPGETFAVELWVLNDAPTPVDALEISAWIEFDDARGWLGEWSAGPTEANTNQRGPTLQLLLPAWAGDRLRLRIEIENRPDLGSCYLLAKARASQPRSRDVAVPAGTTNF